MLLYFILPVWYSIYYWKCRENSTQLTCLSSFCCRRLEPSSSKELQKEKSIEKEEDGVKSAPFSSVYHGMISLQTGHRGCIFLFHRRQHCHCFSWPSRTCASEHMGSSGCDKKDIEGLMMERHHFGRHNYTWHSFTEYWMFTHCFLKDC